MTPRHVSLFACSWILTAGSVLAQLQVGWQVVAPSSNASAVALDSTGQAWLRVARKAWGDYFPGAE